jgi:hypothetical protein
MAFQKSQGENPYFSGIWGHLWIPRPQSGLGMTKKTKHKVKGEGAAKAGPYIMLCIAPAGLGHGSGAGGCVLDLGVFF